MFIYPYKAGSASVKALCEGLNAKRIKLRGSKLVGEVGKTVINWGCSKLPDEVMQCTVINSPESVALASNKLKFFRHIQAHNERSYEYVPIPPFSVHPRDAAYWLSEGSLVVARHKLTGNSGEGIELLEGFNGDIPNAPLYVKYIPKKQEYRIHVAGNQVVDIQRKARRRETPDADINWRIRNHDNGFIFARNDLDVPLSVTKSALYAVRAVGLDFGAVDVIYNERDGQAFVLEVNTAPGLTGQTLEGYVERFKNWEEFVEGVLRNPRRVNLDWDALRVSPPFVIADENEF